LQQIKQFPFTSILGWSNTRYETFSICKRRYFYQYYAKYDPDLSRREIDRFKNLVSIPLEIGSIVHQVFEVLLFRLRQTPEAINQNKFLDFALRTVDNRLKEAVFDEVVYGALPQVTQEDLFPKVELCLQNFLESSRFEWLTQVAIETSEDWIIDPPGYGESRMGDMKVYFKVDFLFPIDEVYYIIDWKTGKQDPEKHRKQLLGYTTWAAYHFSLDPDTVRPTIAYLQPDYEEVDEVFQAADLVSFEFQIQAESEEMYAYCRDVERNLPLEKVEFPQIDDERICEYCNYRGICFPDKYSYDFALS
jgi:hypothetical protein